MSWKPEAEGIARRKRLALEHGGSEAVATQHERGRLTVRERIGGLIDDGSFREQGPAGRPRGDRRTGSADAVFTGELRARLREARWPSDRGLWRGLHPEGGLALCRRLRKSVFSEEMALRYRAPLVRFLEGGGGSVPRLAGALHAAGHRPRLRRPMRRRASCRSRACSARFRSCRPPWGATAGFPAARLVASHFSLMIRETSQVLIGGPKLVERALGQEMTKEELGGYRGASGERCGRQTWPGTRSHAFEMIRLFLSYLPSNISQPAPVRSCDDPTAREAEELLSIVPKERRKGYKMRRLLEFVVDDGSFFELTPGWGRTQITGLARLNGQPVGVMANDPHFYAGAMTADGAQKVRRFLDLCDTFHLPIVSFVDEPGFMIGPEAERSATIRYGMATLCAVMQCTVPFASVIVRKVFGVAGAAHFGPGGDGVANHRAAGRCEDRASIAVAAFGAEDARVLIDRPREGARPRTVTLGLDEQIGSVLGSLPLACYESSESEIPDAPLRRHVFVTWS